MPHYGNFNEAACGVVDEDLCSHRFTPNTIRLLLCEGNTVEELILNVENLGRSVEISGKEIVCLDRKGRPQFRDLLFHRAEPCFYAFDLLVCDGKDIRSERLTDRKHELRRLLSGLPRESRLRYADHVEQHGTALFQRVCEMDLEEIVAKHKFGPYVTDQEHTTWFKIKNLAYSQMQGREELFERQRHTEPTPGWHRCELACAELEQNA